MSGQHLDSDTNTQRNGREASHLYQEMFRRNTAPKLLIDPETGAIADANPAALAFYGYSDEQIRQQRIQDINELSEAEVRAECEKARREERRYFEFRHRLANGEVRDVKVYSGPVVIDGRTYLHSIIHDVTEANRYRENLERYKAIFAALPVGVYRNRPGSDGSFDEVNPAMLRIFGAESAEELKQYTAADLYRDPQQRLRFSKELLAAGEVHRYELDLHTLDGRALRAAITARVHTAEDGAPVFDGVVEDVTELHHAEVFRRQLLESLGEGVFGIDSEGRFTFLNPAGCRLLGFADESQALGHKAHALSHHSRPDGTPLPESACPIQEVQRSCCPLEAWEDWFWRQDGTGFPVQVFAAPLSGADGKGVVVAFSDISTRKAMEQELEHLASHDRLTGLYNRARLYEELEQARAEHERYGTPFSVIMFDIDRFKAVNDRFGHQAGDEVLCELTRRVASALRDTDVQGRWGGEEFLVLASHTGTEGAVELAERLREIVAQAPFSGVGAVTISLGVATYEAGESVERLEGRVDEALYAAKDAGRNRVRLACSGESSDPAPSA